MLRDTMNFMANAKNQKIPAAPGTGVKVLDRRRLASGNYALFVKIMSGKEAGRELWMYERVDSPGFRLVGKTDASLVSESNADKKDAAAKKKTPPPPPNRRTPSPPKNSLSDEQIEELTRALADVRAELETKKPGAELVNFDPKKNSEDIWPVTEPVPPRTSEARCKAIDNRNEALGPVRNQDGVGWCFAYAAADMLSQKTGKRVSAMDISISYFQQQTNRGADKPKLASFEEYSGGFAVNAVATAVQRGVCLEEDVHSSDFEQVQLAKPLEPGETMTDRLNRSLYGMRVEPLLQRIQKFQEIWRTSARDSVSTCKDIFDTQAMFPQLSTVQILAAAEAAGGDTTAYLNYLVHLSCGGRRLELQKDLMAMEEVPGKGNEAKLIPAIDRQLERGQIVGISYDVDFLYRDPANAPPSNNGNHASTIVAREFRDGKCQYLIRNTYGPGCGAYKFPCDRGQVWIPEADLVKTISTIQYFK